MKYSIGESLHGFTVTSARHIRELSGDLYTLEHIQSGARLCYIDNDDANMTYAVTFATPSSDSTGVFHILEHSVLCGSERYPVDDPFVELMKSSLYTFLNAMTFPDKTMYPVSSMNEKDLMNLMSVYTDAVFRPLIYDNENAFRQEGWHIELDDNGKPYYQGVVYNEMKGALGDPEETLYNAVFKEAYKPCQYTTVSGGHPDDIVKLTYEQFIETHKKHYHPSNAYFYLYGRMDIEEKLSFLDSEYLSKVEAQPPVEEPVVEVKPQPKPYHCTYSADEEKSGEDYIALTYPVGNMPTFERLLSMSVLADILSETNYDPLKQRILDKGLAVEVDCGVIEDLSYPLFTIKFRHCDSADLDRIIAETDSVLRELTASGIDHDAVRAKLSTAEFGLREGNASGLTKGLYYGIMIASSWLYGFEPWRYLEYEEALENIKSGLDTGYFEALIRDHLLDNPNRSIVVMTPRAGESRYSEPTSMPDGYSAENRRSDSDPIPHLDLCDIDKKTVPHITQVKSRGASQYLYRPVKSEGIIYANLYFDISSASDEELFYLSLTGAMLTNLATKEHTGAELQTQLGLYTGSMGMADAVYDSGSRVISAMVLRFKALAEYFPQACALADEIAASTSFDDPKATLDVLSQIFTDLKLSIINNSSQLAVTRAAAVRSVRAAAADKLHGLTFYNRLKALKEQLDSGEIMYDSVREKLVGVFEKFIANGSPVLSISCDEGSVKAIEGSALPFEGRLASSLGAAGTPLLCGSLALSAPCDIVFNGFFAALDESFKGGELILAKKILSLEYLWQKIRVENGAYGCGANAGAGKALEMWSYRDPQIGTTIKTFDGAADFLSSLTLSPRAVEDYIISCVRSLDNPLTPQAYSYVCDLLYLSGRTDEILQKERDELLSSNVDKINSVGERMKAFIPARSYCTVGSAENIAANADLYDEMIKL